MKNIKINEIFGKTIQGEGKSAGKEVMFIRTSLCNLQCIWCDTPYTWNFIGTKFEHEGGIKYDKRKEIKEMSSEKVFKLLKYEELKKGILDLCKAVVISGGEPLLQQKALLPLLKILRSEDYWIEIETNGTVEPLDEVLELVDQINCSPKLSNSKMKLSKRVKEKSLIKLSQSEKVNFKFVVSCNDDIDEIKNLIETFNMKDVYLMPLGINNQQLNKTRKATQDLAQNMNLKFSDRLHITLLGGGRGL